MSRAGPPMPATVLRSKSELVALIVDAVAQHYGMTAADIRGRRQSAPSTWARQVTLALAVEFTNETNARIGKLFDLDPTTVLHACRRIKAKASENPHVASDLSKLRTAIETIAPETRHRHESALDGHRRTMRELGADDLASPERELDLLLRELRRSLMAALRLNPTAVLVALKRSAADLTGSKEESNG